MPTGYTSELCDREMTFEEFVWRLARGMGAFVMMRDDRLDAKIPEKFEPSDWNAKALKEAEDKLLKIRDMTTEEANAAALEEYHTLKASFEESNKKTAVVRDRLLRMRSKVADWNPPTHDHEGLKRFMLEQLDSTIRFDGDSYMKMPEKLIGIVWKARKLGGIKHDIEYHTKAHLEEVERTESRNRWIADLRSSVPCPTE